MRQRPLLLPSDPLAPFPPVHEALLEPDGLLAVGGDLEPQRLLNAYRHGIFPWFSKGQPILWWSPDPRMLFRSDRVHLSSRFRRALRASIWEAHADTAFEQVIDACAAAPRAGQRGTWITQEMQTAYVELHRLGHAHSVEIFEGDRLVGGIYGIAVGRMFFGESMFSARNGGSKVALAALARQLRAWNWPLIDAQVANDHLLSLGAETWSRARFIRAIARLTQQPGRIGLWTQPFGRVPASRLADVIAFDQDGG